MIKFRFGLRALAAVQPWGDEQPRLNRYALTDDTVTLAWRNPPDDPHMRLTAPTDGHTTVPTTNFVAAVTDLHDTLIAVLETRLRALETTGPPPGVELDLPQLRRDHTDRATWLRRALDHGVPLA